jgi:outer membrane protein TolC
VSAAGLLFLAGCATPAVPPLPEPTMNVPRPAVAAGAERGAPANPVTVEGAIERAAACSTQIKALRAAVTVAIQRKSAATDIQDPEAVATWGKLDDDLGSPQNSNAYQGVGGRFYVPNPFLVMPRVSARTAELQAAKADLQAARWLVECNVRRLFAEINYLAEDTALAVDLLRQYGEILKDTRARAEHSAATASDVVTAVQRQLQTQNDLDLTRRRYQLAQRDLAALLDLPPASLQIATNASPSAPLQEAAIAFEPLQRLASECRGDLAALRWRTLAAKSAYREALNVRIPWIEHMDATHRDPANEWWVGVRVTLPVFSWTKNHAADALQAQYSLADVNETNGMQLVRREIRDAVEEADERQRQQRRNQSEIAPLIAEMRQTLELLKRTPNLMPAQVATTEAQIIESLRLDLGSRWGYQLSLLNLERAVGVNLSVALQAGEGER